MECPRRRLTEDESIWAFGESRGYVVADDDNRREIVKVSDCLTTARVTNRKPTCHGCTVCLHNEPFV